jgi:hypothetical protein
MGECLGGYGVMGVYGGPNVVEDGLVLALDAGNSKSFIGEQTTNLVPQAVRQHTGGMGSYWSGIIAANNTEKGFPSFKVTTVNNDRLDGFIASNGGNLTNEITYTISADVWVPAGKVVQIRQRMITGGGSRSGSQVNSSLTEQWQRISRTFVADTNTSGSIEGAEVGNTTDVFSFWIKNLQLEQKSYPTPFVDGTRDNWLDVSGNNNTGTYVNNPTYNSGNGGSLVFDGVDDCVSIPKPITSNLPYTVLQWIKPNVALPDTTSSGSRKTPLVGPGPIWNPGYWMTARIFRVHAQTEYRDVTINWVGDTGWHQVGQIFDGTTCYTAIDGSVLLGTRTAYNPPSSTTILIGAETTTGGTPNWNGNISNTTFYNRALTPQEIQQNFIATRSRFSI